MASNNEKKLELYRQLRQESRDILGSGDFVTEITDLYEKYNIEINLRKKVSEMILYFITKAISYPDLFSKITDLGLSEKILEDILKTKLSEILEIEGMQIGGNSEIQLHKEKLLDEIENPTSHRDLYPFTEPMDELLPAPESTSRGMIEEAPLSKPAAPEITRQIPITKPKSTVPGLESVSANLQKDKLGKEKPRIYTNDPYREPVE